MYLTIRLRARVFYEQIVKPKGKPKDVTKDCVIL